MISRFRSTETSDSLAGFSLLEMLVVLGILAMLLTITLPGLKEPSPELTLQKRAVEIQRESTHLQLRAVSEGMTQNFDITDYACEPLKPTQFFLSNGTAFGGDICLSEKNFALRLRLDPLTGRLIRVSP